MAEPRHFLDIHQLETDALRRILTRAAELKRARGTAAARPLAGKTLAMIFEQPSTRTRVSFEVAMTDLGGHAIVLEGSGSQLGRGETAADTARTLSRYVDAIMIRTNAPERLQDMAAHATVPVINGLTHQSHPCQIMADVLTFEEHRGPIAGRTVAWSGDGNNVVSSWIHAAGRLDFALRIACPEQLAPRAEDLAWAQANGNSVTVTSDPAAAVAGADCVVTDTWVSMGDDPGEQRHNLLAPYRVDDRLMAQAAPNAVFMHCLPAHRGDEVTASAMDGPQSVVWDEAENRLHVQKAILLWCLHGE